MLLVIKDFGFSSLNFEKEDFLRENLINQLGYPPLRVDILTSIDGINFKDAYPQKQIITIEEFNVNYIGLNDLIQNKNASGRQQDLVDVATLEQCKKNNSE